MAHTKFVITAQGVLAPHVIESWESALRRLILNPEDFVLSTEIVEPKLTVRIRQDTDPSNPRIDHDNVGVMFCRHDRYALGDKNADDPFEEVEFKIIDGVKITDAQYRNDDIPDGVDRHLLDDAWNAADWEVEHNLRDDIAVCRPLYLHDHSGLTIGHGAFADRWDSGQVGWHYVTKVKLQAEFDGGHEAAKRCIEAELDEYDSYLRGNMWGFELINEDDEVVDSCWGFYGDELDETGILGHLDENLHDAARAAWENRYA